MSKWIVEAYTLMGIIQYEPSHDTKADAEKHMAKLKKENPSISFGVIEEDLVEERNEAVFGD